MFQLLCSRRLACTRWRCGLWASTATTRRSLRNTHEVARASSPSSSRRKSQCAWPWEHNQNTNFVVDFSDEWFHIPNLNAQLLSATSSKRAQSARTLILQFFCQSTSRFTIGLRFLSTFFARFCRHQLMTCREKNLSTLKIVNFHKFFLLPQFVSSE